MSMMTVTITTRRMLMPMKKMKAAILLLPPPLTILCKSKRFLYREFQLSVERTGEEKSEYEGKQDGWKNENNELVNFFMRRRRVLKERTKRVESDFDRYI
mmetsp:Transcript_48176/g.116914  ORF Transcript_48176/g.116914 Transcript_48176/m.116914 type:complete len:100 (-) Transcript_48176:17-316(-)